MKYSSTTMGGASSTLTEVDNRTKYVELGKRYSRVQESRPRSSNLASPSASPNRKKLKQQQRTPEKSALALRTTPSTSNFISSRMSPSSEHESSVERYTSSSGGIGEMVALMSNTISKLSADVSTLRRLFSAPIFTPPKFCGRTTYTTRRIFTPFCFLAPLHN